MGVHRRLAALIDCALNALNVAVSYRIAKIDILPPMIVVVGNLLCVSGKCEFGFRNRLS